MYLSEQIVGPFDYILKKPPQYRHSEHMPQVTPSKLNVDQTVLLSLAMEDFKQNPENYSSLVQKTKRNKVLYKLNHGKVSPAKYLSKADSIQMIADEIKQVRNASKQSFIEPKTPMTN